MQISYSKKMTINTGNYENVILEITASDALSDENFFDKNVLYNNLRQFVNEKLKEDYTRIKGKVAK